MKSISIKYCGACRMRTQNDLITRYGVRFRVCCLCNNASIMDTKKPVKHTKTKFENSYLESFKKYKDDNK